MAAMHCNREEFVSIAKPDCRFSHTLAVYLLRGLLFTKTLRLFVNRLRSIQRSTGPQSTVTAARTRRRAAGRVTSGFVFSLRPLVWWVRALVRCENKLIADARHFEARLG